MASAADTPALRVDTAPPPGQVYYRHRLVTRVCHWLNALCILFLVTTGLNIFNAHPALYWGKYGADADIGRRWLDIGTVDGADGAARGLTQIGSLKLDTTGVLGTSRGSDGAAVAQGFPEWVTFPHSRDLATARRWHFFFAWAFILSGLVYLVYGFATRHLQHDVWPRLRQLAPANIWHDVVRHARLQFPRGASDKRYHVLQRLAYAATIFVFLPMMVLTGLSMSPGIDAAAGGILPSLFGGRQSARSLHFLFMDLTVAFVVVHIAMVVLAGAINQMRSMITGWYDVGVARPGEHGE